MNELERPDTAVERYAFADFTLDVHGRRLTRRGRTIPLAPKTLEVLIALVRHAPSLVTKEQLLQAVWPAVFVEEGILTVHVAKLRRALGDARRESRCIETVSRFGYRFIAVVQRQP